MKIWVNSYHGKTWNLPMMPKQSQLFSGKRIDNLRVDRRNGHQQHGTQHHNPLIRRQWDDSGQRQRPLVAPDGHGQRRRHGRAASALLMVPPEKYRPAQLWSMLIWRLHWVGVERVPKNADKKKGCCNIVTATGWRERGVGVKIQNSYRCYITMNPPLFCIPAENKIVWIFPIAHYRSAKGCFCHVSTLELLAVLESREIQHDWQRIELDARHVLLVWLPAISLVYDKILRIVEATLLARSDRGPIPLDK